MRVPDSFKLCTLRSHGPRCSRSCRRNQPKSRLDMKINSKRTTFQKAPHHVAEFFDGELQAKAVHDIFCLGFPIGYHACSSSLIF